MLGYDTLTNYFRTFFALIQHHKWEAEWLEKMPPWEKFIYLDMLKQHLQHLDDLAKQQKRK